MFSFTFISPLRFVIRKNNPNEALSGKKPIVLGVVVWAALRPSQFVSGQF